MNRGIILPLFLSPRGFSIKLLYTFRFSLVRPTLRFFLIILRFIVSVAVEQYNIEYPKYCVASETDYIPDVTFGYPVISVF